MSTSNIIFHELIGRRVTVVESSENTLKGISGEVVDETKQTLKINTDKGLKIIVKSNATLSIELPDGTYAKIDGKRISYRPEDRIGRMSRKC